MPKNKKGDSFSKAIYLDFKEQENKFKKSKKIYIKLKQDY